MWLYDCNLREPAKLLLTDAAATVQRTAERPAGMAYVQRQRPVNHSPSNKHLPKNNHSATCPISISHLCDHSEPISGWSSWSFFASL